MCHFPLPPSVFTFCGWGEGTFLYAKVEGGGTLIFSFNNDTDATLSVEPPHLLPKDSVAPGRPPTIPSHFPSSPRCRTAPLGAMGLPKSLARWTTRSVGSTSGGRRRELPRGGRGLGFERERGDPSLLGAGRGSGLKPAP